MRLLLAVTLLIVGAQPGRTQDGAPARPGCGLAAAQAPALAGLRLGMTPQQVMALVPGSAEDPEVRASLARPPRQYGVSSFNVRPDRYPSKGKFAGVSRIAFTLLDGRVYTINVSYNGPEYPNVDEFVAKVVEGTTLPAADAWEAYAGLDTQLKVLKCADFEMRVFAGGQGGTLNYVLMTDLDATRTLKGRRAKAGEKTGQ
jgi:hypothetical protein